MSFCGAVELVLLALPFGRERRGSFLELRQLLVEALQAVLRARIVFLLQRLVLDLAADDLAVDGIELLGLGIDLHAQARRGLVDEVDRLVGKEAIGDVAVRQGRRGDERRVLDAHAVVQLVFLLEAAQDRDRVLDRRLGDEDRLEAPGERRVLLDMLSVFVERGRADAMQLAARQRRLQEVRRIHRAIGLAGADERVHLVDEEDDARLRRS